MFFLGFVGVIEIVWDYVYGGVFFYVVLLMLRRGLVLSCL